VKEAKKTGSSLGEFIRDSMEVRLSGSSEKQKDSFFDDKTIFKGKTPNNMAVDHDAYLYGDVE